jgi:hypothetical protein
LIAVRVDSVDTAPGADPRCMDWCLNEAKVRQTT